MGTAVAEKKIDEIIYRLPSEILVEDHYNVRPWTSSDEGATEIEARDIEQLADSIEELTQIEAGIVLPSKTKTPDGEERFVLYSGHRRMRAIALINQRKDRRGQPLMPMRFTVDRSGIDIKRKAIHSNLHRAINNPMDLVKLISSLRKEHGWGHDTAGLKQVAKYLNISLSAVRKHEPFLGAPEEIQKRLASGQLSVDSAHDMLVGVKPEKMPEVLKRAEEIQNQTDKAQAERNEDFVKEHGSKEQRQELKAKKGKPEAVTSEAPKRIKKNAVTQAIRDVEGAQVQHQSKTLKDVKGLFEEIADGPAYGKEDSPARLFARYVLKWLSGGGSDNTLLTKYCALIGLSADDKKRNEKAASIKAEAEEKKVKKAAKTAKPIKAVKTTKSPKSKSTKSPRRPASKSIEGGLSATA